MKIHPLSDDSCLENKDTFTLSSAPTHFYNLGRTQQNPVATTFHARHRKIHTNQL